MREVKFRVWDGQKMATPEAIGEYGWYLTGRDFENGRNNPFDTLMQYTGLKDKNGKEIYEGDIVKCEGCEHVETVPAGDDGYRDIYADVIGQVIFAEAEYQFTGHSAGPLPLHAYEEFEVIGNIYETPNLLNP